MTKKKKPLIFIPLSILSALVVVAVSLLGALFWNRFSRGVVPTEAQLAAVRAAGQTYDRVVIFGVDGAGGHFGEMDTPSFDRVFLSEERGGSVTYEATAQYPTESAQNWGSMLHGVRSGKHGLTNEIASSRPFTDERYPSLFKVYAERHPGAYMASVVDWDVVNGGIIEQGIEGLTRINVGELIREEVSGLDWYASEYAIDTAVADEAIRELRENDPVILFTHFDCVDAAGHLWGSGSTKYEEAISHVDDQIGRIFDACEEMGIADSTLFICVSDHGHKLTGGHGRNCPVVRHTTFAVAGGKGNVISGTPGYVVTQDLASVVFYALGERQPDAWDSSVPKNMFTGLA